MTGVGLSTYNKQSMTQRFQLMSARRKFLFTWIGLAVFLTAAFSGIYLHYAIQMRTDEFRARAELLAWAFADRAAFDLAQGNKQDLEFLTGTLVLGNVLYAEVVHQGQTLAVVSRLAEPLLPAAIPSGTWQIERKVSQNQAYWDIQRALPDVDGYIRLGLIVGPLENATRSQIFFVAGIAIAFLVLVSLVAIYWAGHLFAPPVAETQPPTTVPESTVAPGVASVPTEPPPLEANLSIIQIGELVIDDASKRVEMRNQAVELSPKEFELLRLLAREPGRVFSNEEILSQVWTDSHLATAQDVKQYIYFLRQKLEVNPKEPQLIVTARGFGYKLQV
ncbi:MAG: hypothetical protein A2Z21_05700 [Candidatus Fraserbacteria bacterium RBG_16_55_9]|uniref:OmpR/PhoB-type domain-containing protein n=1 Tax=Fraserbacteria sp. (strain RBG_16_55_9) TaxID=1817864 RepID=A0A1F5UPM7_FRAXR|nr:MAG: hypothetical protein A2Z21_05700 [Candidatus Fraserbacteria bacterium RBG_16_55_9]